ncbi:hypothetical protein FLK61_40060 [Paenalkalicoccus suaedae]|uniref:Uncharacterized protein n=1 Tax=Paenalkalicoccus suaedae TaxID=2592382 RepID=A0A859FI31_9BACI|nr:hypothetical protein [Paenalkalicoccus suaedae]QKS72807.1 hypothetical protein FLK61_40060 [Paenalkalicoccus suaedae]
MELQGKNLAELLANRFIMFNRSDELLIELMCSQLFIRWITPSDDLLTIHDYGFIKFDWSENDFGESILLSQTQQTPDPLPYRLTNDTSSPISVDVSTYFPKSNYVKHVSGLGFETEGEEYVYILLLETEKEYIYIEGAPGLMEIRIATQELEVDGYYQVIFTTKVEGDT